MSLLVRISIAWGRGVAKLRLRALGLRRDVSRLRRHLSGMLLALRGHVSLLSMSSLRLGR